MLVVNLCSLVGVHIAEALRVRCVVLSPGIIPPTSAGEAVMSYVVFSVVCCSERFDCAGAEGRAEAAADAV